jgi:RNA polymerase sigma factor (sigma-70 family)
MTEDEKLLAEYSQTQSEAAFREIVSRYLNLVYSTALRLVAGDAHRAEDVAQTVFVALAGNAGKLPPKVMLGGWLHRHTCFVAANTMRGERRRLAREREAVEMNSLDDNTGADFLQLAPLLDETINQLDQADRTAILLRFFEQKDFRVIGERLESSEDAARMRVNRAVEKLRELLAQGGIRTTSGALSAAIAASSVEAAPLGLAAKISAVAVSGAAATTTTIVAATKTIAMTTLQKIAVAAALTVAVGAGLYQAKKAADARAENQRLQAQQAPLAEQIQQLQQERAALIAENTKLESGQNQKELLALRGKVTLLSNEATKDAAKKAWNPMANMSSDPRMLEHMRVQSSRMVKRDYAKLFSNLNLPQVKADALNDLITKKHNANNDLMAKLISGNPDQSEMDKMGAETANQKMAVDEEIKQLLGADDYSKFQNYEGSLEQRSEISGPEGFAQELPAGQKLTSDQTEQLISAMAEVKQNFNFSSGAKPIGSTLGITAVAMEKPASGINMDAFTAEMQQLDDQYLARAQSILTPDQYTAFQGYLANQIQNFQMGIMMAPKTSQSGDTSR